MYVIFVPWYNHYAVKTCQNISKWAELGLDPSHSTLFRRSESIAAGVEKASAGGAPPGAQSQLTASARQSVRQGARQGLRQGLWQSVQQSVQQSAQQSAQHSVWQSLRTVVYLEIHLFI
jgi:hypothetical protein